MHTGGTKVPRYKKAGKRTHTYSTKRGKKDANIQNYNNEDLESMMKWEVHLQLSLIKYKDIKPNLFHLRFSESQKKQREK